jgi:hypothetical protein
MTDDTELHVALVGLGLSIVELSNAHPTENNTVAAHVFADKARKVIELVITHGRLAHVAGDPQTGNARVCYCPIGHSHD